MTQTLEPLTAPQQQVDDWLAAFEEALRTRDVERAAGMFAATSFWRDLVAFSWNLTTVEDRRAWPTCCTPRSRPPTRRGSPPRRSRRRRTA